MSGTVTNFNFNILPIAQDLIPRQLEGSKACCFQIYWQSIFDILPVVPIVQNINLLAQYNTGQFTTIQAVWIDNSTVPYPVSLLANETGQMINVPAFTQGMYPLFCSVAPILTATLNIELDPVYGQGIGECTTRFAFLNTPQRYFEKPSAISRAFTFDFSEVVPLADGGIFQPFPVFGAGGGLASIGPTSYFRFSAIQLTFKLLTGATITQGGNLQIVEQGNSGPYIRQLCSFLTVSGTSGIVYDQQIFFPPAGILQIDPINSWGFIINAGGAPTGGWGLEGMITGDIVQIS